MHIILNSLNQSHEYVKKAVLPGEIVVDATMGNGNDTLFLAQLVGPLGKVFAFDIQEEALQNTKIKLTGHINDNRVMLIKDGHQNIDKYIENEISAAMFNLGYLPGGDHTIGTKPADTIEAVEKIMRLLKKNGIITIVIYYGGDSGFEEKEKFLDYVKTIDDRKYTVMQTQFVNQENCPPIFVCIEKRDFYSHNIKTG